MSRVAIIGGTGLDSPEIFITSEQIEPDTPYGAPSSALHCGVLNGTEVVILFRHGNEHTIPPSQVNNRANIYALKMTGCTHILSTTACGSLRDDIRRGDIVIPDQFIDFTKFRKITFFEEFKPGEMKHTPMADPFDENLRKLLIASSRKQGINFHERGTVVTIEGPRFTTRAESRMFRTLGADIINMSVAPEVILANEIGIPYASIAMSTDYDSWKDDEIPVSWEEVLEVFKKNVSRVLRLLVDVIPLIK